MAINLLETWSPHNTFACGGKTTTKNKNGVDYEGASDGGCDVDC